MPGLVPCVHGGGSSCVRQGGDGCCQHVMGYVHPFPTVAELGEPAGDAVLSMEKSSDSAYRVPALEEFFDEDLSKSVLNTEFFQIVDTQRLVKSLYDFDLDTPEGVTRLLELLPVMDPEILEDMMKEVWSGYVPQDAPPALMRAELRGYLLDYLENSNTQNDA